MIRTSDLALATVLRYHEHEPVRIELDGSKAVWCFDDSDGAIGIADEYRLGVCSVEPREYNRVLRRTRDHMFGFLRGNGIQPPPTPIPKGRR